MLASTQATQAARPRLVREQRAVMLRHLLAFEDLFRLGCERLQEEHFSRDRDFDLLLVWQTTTSVVTRLFHGRLPADRALLWTIIDGEIRARFAAHPDEFPAHFQQVLLAETGLVPWLFVGETGLDREFGRRLLLDYLRERILYDPLRMLIDSLGAEVPDNMGDLLSGLSQQERALGAIGTPSGVRPLLEGYAPPQVLKSSTGIDFMDELMNGGDAAGETYILLGAYGSGKTAFGTQLTYRKALQYQLAFERGEPLQDCHLFAYEAPYNELMSRMWSHAARVSTESLEDFNVATLSRTGNLKPYEMRLFAREIAELGVDQVLGEYERLQQVQPLLGVNIFLHDFTGYALPGQDRPSGLGMGYIPEIAQVLENYVQQGRRVGTVVIDYAGLCCRRYINATGRRQEDMRHLLNQFADQVRLHIVAPFRCRVWFFHQLSGAANARVFGSRIHSTDAAECKSVAENVHYSFVIGPRHLETECMELACHKARRSRLAPAPVLVRLRGEFNTIERAADMQVSPVTGDPSSLVDYAAQLSHVNLDGLPDTAASAGDDLSDILDLSE